MLFISVEEQAGTRAYKGVGKIKANQLNYKFLDVRY